jgi:hypothetical protein
VGARVTEILPYTDEERQHSLELDDPIERLRYLKTRMED